MQNCSSFALVAVEGLVYHFDAEYSYYIPARFEKNALPGCRVMVPFGNGNRKKQGLILAVKPIEQLEDTIELKPISAVLDEVPLFDDERISLIRWLKENTFCTLFEAAKAMLPAGIGLQYVVSYIAENVDEKTVSKLGEKERAVYDYLKDKSEFVKREKIVSDLSIEPSSNVIEKLVKKGILITNVDAKRKTGDLTVKNARLAMDEESVAALLPSLTAKQRSVARLMLDIGCAGVKEICYFTGVTSVVVSALEKKGIIEFFDSEIYRKPKYTEKAKDAKPTVLTDSQRNAFEYLYGRYKSGKANAALLFGVTGSGKTRVFLELINKVISDGKGVILMVPEIALTPQTLSIFYAHFGDTVAVFHSALSAGERIDEWKRVKNGDAKIVIGTRSAVFAPFDNLGLIVMDEEHEHTYKSEMTPRYHARDVARFRCAYNNAMLLLSSATPSLETYKNAVDGKYGLAKLTDRFGSAVLPDVVTVDVSDSKSVISHELYKEIQSCLSEKKQAILLMNRRGYNTFASCKACKTVITCPNCSISLTYHSANGRLMCHYCGHSVKYTDTCPECGEKAVTYSGYGTQRIEDELETMFPGARILRMDADTTSAKYSYEKKLTMFSEGEYDILLGTQMVAKGLDFPNVTLVGIISIDQQLYNDDFRSSEKAFDLLTQVIGRAGRGSSKGKAFIQTVLPDNDIITLSASQDYQSFYDTESVIRKNMVYPPYCDICQVTLTSENYAKSTQGAFDFMNMLKSFAGGEYNDVKLVVLGPIKPRVNKISNKFRNVIIIKCKNNKRFREMMGKLLTAFMRSTDNSVSIAADINPLN